jgi:hypothetical protein
VPPDISSNELPSARLFESNSASQEIGVKKNGEVLVQRRLVFHAIAWLLVPLAFAGYSALSYRIALSADRLPFLGGNEWRWWLGFILALLIGVGCVWSASSTARRAVAFAIVYCLVMSVALAVLHFWIACAFGDCL